MRGPFAQGRSRHILIRPLLLDQAKPNREAGILQSAARSRSRPTENTTGFGFQYCCPLERHNLPFGSDAGMEKNFSIRHDTDHGTVTVLIATKAALQGVLAIDRRGETTSEYCHHPRSQERTHLAINGYCLRYRRVRY